MDREELILSLRPVVERIACIKIRQCPPEVRREDLIGEGWIGAIRAVDRWDSSKAALKTFAERRVEGAIRDYLRRIDPLKRKERAEHRARLREAVPGCVPIEPVRFVELSALLSIAGCEAAVIMAVDVARLLRLVSPPKRATMELHYFGSLNSQQIAQVLGCKPNAVRQRIFEGLNQIRRKVRCER